MPARRASATGPVREELAHVAVPKACDRRAEMAALLRASGTLHLLGRGRCAVEIEAEHPAVARRVVAALHELLGGRTEVRMVEPGRGHPRLRLVVRAEEADPARLVAAGVLARNGRPPDGVPRAVVSRRCCAGAYLRGAFLARGAVAPPRGAAHLEVRAPDERTATDLASLLGRLGARAKVRMHRGLWTAYAKDGESVGRALAAMGAHRAYLLWEEGAVWKSVRGRASRLANADAANARRIARSSAAQLAAIEAVAEHVGIAALPPALREIIRLRRAHPEASIEDLGALCDPPVSKGAAAGRLRRVEEIARLLAG